jgi:tetratricopeptide (TPR) repeat protein
LVAGKKDKSTKRTLIAEAQAAAIEGRWEEALTINDKLIERFPREAEALNRKGRALIELRQLGAARDAYSEALKSDPANMIARRNLQRLEMLYSRDEGTLEGADTARTTLPRPNAFIEEVGKTWVEEIANPADLSHLAEVSPGEELQLVAEDGKVFLVSDDGVKLGEVGAPIGQRLAALMEGGNRYESFALGISRQSLRVLIRETFKDPSQATKLSFPEQVRKTQELMRERELLFQREEGDFIFRDDEDGELDDDHSGADRDADPDDDDDRDTDASAYVDDSVNADDDEDRDAM